MLSLYHYVGLSGTLFFSAPVPPLQADDPNRAKSDVGEAPIIFPVKSKTYRNYIIMSNSDHTISPEPEPPAGEILDESPGPHFDPTAEFAWIEFQKGPVLHQKFQGAFRHVWVKVPAIYP